MIGALLSSLVVILMFLRCVLQLLVTAKLVPSALIFSTLMMAIRSCETAVLTKATRWHIPEDSIIHVTVVRSGRNIVP
jgi:hypothetical protein